MPSPRFHSTTRAFSIASVTAISEAKKIGSARNPPSASGAFDGGMQRSELHSRPASITRARNSRVRGSLGAVKICSGGPSSQITPGVEEADLVGDLARERHLVRREDHRHPGLGQPAHEIQHVGDELRVECARDLVEQHQLRPHRQGARDRDALLLTAGEPVGELVRLLREPDLLEQLERDQPSLARAGAVHLPRRQHDVLEHRHVREEVVGLEDDADLAAQRVHVDVAVGDLVAVDDDAALVDPLEQVDAAQERRLAGARRADQADDVVPLDLERHVVEHAQVAERLRDLVELDEAHVAPARSRRSRVRIRWSVKRASGIVSRTNSTAATVYDVKFA